MKHVVYYLVTKRWPVIYPIVQMTVALILRVGKRKNAGWPEV